VSCLKLSPSSQIRSHETFFYTETVTAVPESSKFILNIKTLFFKINTKERILDNPVLNKLVITKQFHTLAALVGIPGDKIGVRTI
jgi:hypothetical protein